MKKKVIGPVCKFGHDADIGLIMPSYHLREHSRLPIESLIPGTPPKFNRGDIIVAGRNLGCYSSPANPADCQEAISYLNQADVPCIIAASFERHLFRAAINAGIPALMSPEAFEQTLAGEQVTVDFERGEIACERGIISFPQYPEIISKILLSGGLLAYTRKSLGK
jgi:3-isopropylmalate dehydratase small subunit